MSEGRRFPLSEQSHDEGKCNSRKKSNNREHEGSSHEFMQLRQTRVRNKNQDKIKQDCYKEVGDRRKGVSIIIEYIKRAEDCRHPASNNQIYHPGSFNTHGPISNITDKSNITDRKCRAGIY